MNAKMLVLKRRSYATQELELRADLEGPGLNTNYSFCDFILCTFVRST
jgi:hypothetical protein